MSKRRRRLKSFLKYSKIEELKAEYGNIFNISQDLAIENYELKLEMERKKQKIEHYRTLTNNYKSINNNLERILKIEEETIIKKDLKIQLLEEMLKNNRKNKNS
jgi:hypothetical protein